MSVLRELVTLFTFKTEESGLKEYNEKVKKTVETTKKLLEGVGLAIGATVALSTFANLAEKLSDSVKEARLLRHQFDNIITPDLDPDKMLQGLYDIAQETGGLYTEVADNFKDIAISSKEFGISQVTALDATRNIAKALEVGYLKEDQQTEVMNTLNFAFKRGILSARQFSDLFIKAPDLINTLGQNIGLTNKQMRDLANSGKFTTDLLINGLAKTNKHLNEMFDAKPETLLDAWHYVYNMIVRVGVIFSKHEKTIDRIAKGIKRFADTVYAAGKTIVDALGGVDAVLSLLEAAFVAAFGIVTVNMIFAVIGAITALGTAAFAASLKAGAISLAFIGLTYAIEDLMVWMRGGDSVAGRLLGPFDKLGEKFDKLLAPFQAIKEIFSGNVGEGWENLKKAIGDIDSKTRLLGEIIVGIPALFLAWNAVAFVKLLTTIGRVTTSVLGIGKAAKKSQEELDGLSNKRKGESSIPESGKGTKKKKAGTGTKTDTTAEEPARAPTMKNPPVLGTVAKTTDLIMNAFNLLNDAGMLSEAQSKRIDKMNTGALIGEGIGSIIPGSAGSMVGGALGGAVGYVWDKPEFLPEFMNLSPEQLIMQLLNMREKNPFVTPNLSNLYQQKLDAEKNKPIAVVPAPETKDKPRGWASFAADAGAYANQYANGGRPPGAILPPAPITIIPPANNIPITNNINVTVPAEMGEIKATITSEVNSAMTQVVNGITTKLNQAAPVTEARAQ